MRLIFQNFLRILFYFLLSKNLKIVKKKFFRSNLIIFSYKNFDIHFLYEKS